MFTTYIWENVGCGIFKLTCWSVRPWEQRFLQKFIVGGNSDCKISAIICSKIQLIHTALLFLGYQSYRFEGENIHKWDKNMGPSLVLLVNSQAALHKVQDRRTGQDQDRKSRQICRFQIKIFRKNFHTMQKKYIYFMILFKLKIVDFKLNNILRIL